MKKKLFLHIGLPKTGTTAIQENFFLNRKVLERNNIFYPSFPWRHDKQWTKNVDVFAHHPIALNLYKPIIQEIGEELFNQVNQSKCNRVIVSSEAFAFHTKPKDIKNFFDYIFEEISIIIYLRDPIDLLFSDYIQGIKGNRRLTQTFDIFLKEKLNAQNSIDFDAQIQKWGNFFGHNNITVGFYAKNGNLINDFFLTSFGVPLPQNWVYPKRKDSNPRLPHEILEKIRQNNFIPMKDKEHFNFINRVVTPNYKNAFIDRNTLPSIREETKNLFQSWINKNRAALNIYINNNIEFPPFDSYKFNLEQK
ncbi:MAG: sulfotransferase domain-containing protein [Desulfobulbaceae bacterium]|nr:sulfotransferase domain-containing protein [Desulfobulbaceae bacterium]